MLCQLFLWCTVLIYKQNVRKVLFPWKERELKYTEPKICIQFVLSAFSWRHNCCFSCCPWLFVLFCFVCVLSADDIQIGTVLPKYTQPLHSHSNHSATLYTTYLSSHPTLVMFGFQPVFFAMSVTDK